MIIVGLLLLALLQGQCFLFLVASNDLLQAAHYVGVFLPDQVEGKLALDVKEMLAKLAGHIGVQGDQRVESHPEVIGWQLKLVKHVLHRQVAYILAVEVD